MYDFSSEFERVMMYMAATDTTFWSRTGRHIRPAWMRSRTAKVVFEVCKEILEEDGVDSISCLIVLQRLRRRVGRGVIRKEEWKQIAEVFDNVEDRGLPPVEPFLREVAVSVKEAERKALALDVSRRIQNGDPAERVIGCIEAFDRIGQSNDEASALGVRVASDIAFQRTAERLPVGIAEMDVKFNGGVPRGTLSVIVMESGGGKSMWLSHQMVRGVLRGQRVLYATLELPPFTVHARALAALSGESIDAVMSMPQDRVELLIKHTMDRVSGSYEVRDFSPRTTTVRDIRGWVDAFKRKSGSDPDVLVVDYGDRIGVSDRSITDSYRIGEMVFEDMRRLAVEKKMWIWTASQASRNTSKRRFVDLDHTADSMGKVRVADLVVTGVRAGSGLKFFAAKNRHGESRFFVGPYRSDFEHGRLLCESSQ